MKRRILPLVVGARARSGVGLSAASIVASIAAGLALLAPLSGREAALAAGPSACQPRRFQLSGDFSLTPVLPILSNSGSPVQATLVGTAGTFQGHVVFQPVAAPPPAISEGCKENSRFTVTGFAGALVANGDPST